MLIRAVVAFSVSVLVGCADGSAPAPQSSDGSVANALTEPSAAPALPPPVLPPVVPATPTIAQQPDAQEQQKNEPQQVAADATAIRLKRGQHFDMMFGQLSASPLISTRFSVQAWMRWNPDNEDLPLMGNLWSCVPDEERRCCWVVHVKKVDGKAQLRLDYADLNGRPHSLAPFTLPLDDRWHHLLVDNNQNGIPASDAKLRLFVDGQLVASSAHGTPHKFRLAQRFFVGPASDRSGAAHLDVRGFYYEPGGIDIRSPFQPPDQLSFASSSQKVYGLYDFSKPYADRVADTGEYPRNGKLFGGAWINANTGEPVPAIAAPADSKLDPLLVPISLAPDVLGCNFELHEVTSAKGKQPYVWASPLKLKGDDSRAVRHNTLAHEIMRQAMLCAARHELGLLTRDATLGEAAPGAMAKPSAVLTLHISSIPSERVAISIVQQQENGEDHQLWTKEVRISGTQAESYSTILELAETWSRTEFAALLRKVTPGNKTIPPRKTADIPKEVVEPLASMNYVDQYRAQRALHEVIRQEGASPELLAGLANSYANMGMLTEHHWNTAPKAYKARGLLYSQRLLSQYPTAPLGLWHRAYAWALTGVHAHALADLDAAQKLLDKAPASSGNDVLWDQPSWTESIRCHCRFDSRGLETIISQGESPQLATLLLFFVNEDPTVAARTTSIGVAALEKNPACFRVLDSLFDIGEVSIMHRVTAFAPASHTQLLVTRLPAVPGLPEAIQETLAQDKDKSLPDEVELVKQLKHAGQVDSDQAEPSWQALAALISETHFTQAWCRAAFMRYYWSVPVDEYVASVKPLIAGHPLEQYVNLIGRSGIALSWQLHGILKNLSRSELPIAAQLKFIDTLAFINDDKRREILTTERTPCDDTYYELLSIAGATTRNTRLKYAYRMLAFSPDSPHAMAMQVELDQLFTEEDANKLEQNNPSAIVLRSLIERGNGDNDAILRRLKSYVALSPDYFAYAQMAQLYQAAGQEDLWLATLEEYVARPNGGLEQSRARVEIAKHYMNKGEIEKAVPYAEAAAESYAAWAILCAVECYEKQGDLDKADLWYSRAAQRYPDLAVAYRRWCDEHGRKPTKPVSP